MLYFDPTTATFNCMKLRNNVPNDPVLCYAWLGSTCMAGSGKTFTMSSIYERAAQDIFGHLDDAVERFAKPPTVSVSFVEIAGDACHDLLNAFEPAQLLTGADGSVHPFPVTEPVVTSAAELLAMIRHGMGIRTTAATGVHDGSSRSHAILRVYIHRNDAEALAAAASMANRPSSAGAGGGGGRGSERGSGGGSSSTIIEGTLTLVDLAGSEHKIDSMYVHEFTACLNDI